MRWVLTTVVWSVCWGVWAVLIMANEAITSPQEATASNLLFIALSQTVARALRRFGRLCRERFHSCTKQRNGNNQRTRNSCCALNRRIIEVFILTYMWIYVICTDFHHCIVMAVFSAFISVYEMYLMSLWHNIDYHHRK